MESSEERAKRGEPLEVRGRIRRGGGAQQICSPQCSIPFVSIQSRALFGNGLEMEIKRSRPNIFADFRRFVPQNQVFCLSKSIHEVYWWLWG